MAPVTADESSAREKRRGTHACNPRFRFCFLSTKNLFYSLVHETELTAACRNTNNVVCSFQAPDRSYRNDGWRGYAHWLGPDLQASDTGARTATTTTTAATTAATTGGGGGGGKLAGVVGAGSGAVTTAVLGRAGRAASPTVLPFEEAAVRSRAEA